MRTEARQEMGELEQEAVSLLSLDHVPEYSHLPRFLESAVGKCVTLKTVKCEDHTTILGFPGHLLLFSSPSAQRLPFLSSPLVVKLSTASHFYFMVFSQDRHVIMPSVSE